MPTVAGTYWAAYNAVTEWVTHTRKGTKESRLNSSWFGQGKMLKQKALKVALEMAA
ncbi:DUF932 domain-containing protein [Candidatus Riflebacteria bacterium]